MAPKKGGSSSGTSSSSGGSSGVSSCEECLSELELRGFEWSSGKVNALFAFAIIAVVVMIACLVLAPRFKWVRKDVTKTDRLRHSGYIWATSCALCYFLLRVIDTALTETETVVTHLYYILYILQSAFGRIADLMILAIILRTIYESTASSMVRPLPVIKVVAIIKLALLTLAGFGLYTASAAYNIANGSSYFYFGQYTWGRYGNYIDFAYDCLYFLIAIIVVVYSSLIHVKEHSKATILMAAVVAPALFLRSLFTLASDGLFTFPNRNTTYDAELGLSYTSAFLYILMVYPIFLGLAFIGCIKPRDPNFLMEQKPAGTAYQNGIHGLPVEYTPNGAPQAYHGTPQGHQGPVYYNTGAPTAHPTGQTGTPGTYGQPLIA